MNRRTFLRALAGAGVLGLGGSAFAFWPEQGLKNPCKGATPPELLRHPLLRSLWDGIDPAKVWDAHAHLVGSGDSGSGAWFSPKMGSLWHPLLSLQKSFFVNAGCMQPESMDASYVDRLLAQMRELPPGCKILLFAFDWAHDGEGRPDPGRSIFHVPNRYAQAIAAAAPERFEWVASIHPHRADAVEALRSAAANGARAIKWLPSAMAIDPASARCDASYAELARLDLPLVSHAGRELAVQGGNQAFGNPLRLRRPLEHGVRVVVAHCASDGSDIDLDRGANGPRVRSFDLFARMMAQPQFEKHLYADISALTQRNRDWAFAEVLARPEWHARLLNGSDYPLPGIFPMFEVRGWAERGMVDPAAVAPLQQLREHNPLYFDFALKRLLHRDGRRLPTTIFETRPFFDRSAT